MSSIKRIAYVEFNESDDRATTNSVQRDQYSRRLKQVLCCDRPNLELANQLVRRGALIDGPVCEPFTQGTLEQIVCRRMCTVRFLISHGAAISWHCGLWRVKTSHFRLLSASRRDPHWHCEALRGRFTWRGKFTWINVVEALRHVSLRVYLAALEAYGVFRFRCRDASFDRLVLNQRAMLEKEMWCGVGRLRTALLSICVALHSAQLPAFVLLKIVNRSDARFQYIPMHTRWRAIVLVKHFEAKNE